jgi:transcriptional regulator with XRE-family HTH domain
MTDVLPADLAKMIGVPPSTISRIESGQRQHGEGLIQKLSAALRVTPEWLRYGVVAIESPRKDGGVGAPTSPPGFRPYPPLPETALRQVAEGVPAKSGQKKEGRG